MQKCLLLPSVKLWKQLTRKMVKGPTETGTCGHEKHSCATEDTCWLCFQIQQESVHNSGSARQFLAVDPILWSSRDDFMAAEAFIHIVHYFLSQNRKICRTLNFSVLEPPLNVNFFCSNFFCYAFSLNGTKLGVQTVKKEAFIFFICLWTTIYCAMHMRCICVMLLKLQTFNLKYEDGQMVLCLWNMCIFLLFTVYVMFNCIV